jgi:hypothetical protein
VEVLKGHHRTLSRQLLCVLCTLWCHMQCQGVLLRVAWKQNRNQMAVASWSQEAMELELACWEVATLTPRQEPMLAPRSEATHSQDPQQQRQRHMAAPSSLEALA